MALDPKIKWHDIAKWGVEGKGWDDTPSYYDRLPRKAQGVVTEGVWNLSHSPTGLCAFFNSDSPKIHARWKLKGEQLGEPNFNVIGFSGVDLYAMDAKGDWRWAGAPKHDSITNQTPESTLVDGLTPKKRKYLVYLPLRNPLKKLEIGIEPGFSLTPVKPRRKKEIVYYGTSIVHGAFSSRPGLTHSQIVARRLKMPLINLGFSGNAKMEPEFAKLLTELDASVFVIDPLANMDLPMVEERAENFMRIMLEAHPEVPMLMVEDVANTAGWLRPSQMEWYRKKWAAYSRIYKKLRREGAKHLHYLKGEKLYGTDNEASVDGIHPSDLGYMRMSEFLIPALKKALGR